MAPRDRYTPMQKSWEALHPRLEIMRRRAGARGAVPGNHGERALSASRWHRPADGVLMSNFVGYSIEEAVRWFPPDCNGHPGKTDQNRRRDHTQPYPTSDGKLCCRWRCWRAAAALTLVSECDTKRQWSCDAWDTSACNHLAERICQRVLEMLRAHQHRPPATSSLSLITQVLGSSRPLEGDCPGADIVDGRGIWPGGLRWLIPAARARGGNSPRLTGGRWCHLQQYPDFASERSRWGRSLAASAAQNRGPYQGAVVVLARGDPLSWRPGGVIAHLAGNECR